MKGVHSILLCVVASIGPSAYAQTSFLYDNPYLLSLPSVQKDLKIDGVTAQRTIQRFEVAYRKAGPELHKLLLAKPQTATIQKKLQAKTDSLQREGVALLTPSQRSRFHQINLQLTGAKILLHPALKFQVGLSEKQSKLIAKAVSAEPTAATVLFPKPEEVFNPASVVGRRQSEEATLALLTASQRAKWKTLLGPTFQP